MCVNSRYEGKIYVDGTSVVRNTGNQGERCATRGLRSGNHVVKGVTLFNTGSPFFMMRYSGPVSLVTIRVSCCVYVLCECVCLWTIVRVCMKEVCIPTWIFF